MSAEAVTAVLYHSNAKGAAKLVLWGIANHHSDHGAWPAISTLARYAGGISLRRVKQIIKELVDLGEIVVEEQGGFGYQQYKTNRYYILVQCPEDCDGSLQHRTGVQPASVRGEIFDIRGEKNDTSGVKPISPEPNNKPNKNLREPSSRLPDDWQPREADLELMREHFPDIDLKLETHAFRDYWRGVAGARGKKSDWDATWRNWIRNSYKRLPKRKENDWDALRRWAEEEERNNEAN
jgi:hypothetical protein